MVALVGIPSGRSAVGLRFFLRHLIAGLLILPKLAFAQSVAPASSQSTPDPARFQILDQRTVSFRRHSITFARVAPPRFSAIAATPSPSPIPPQPYASYQFSVFLATVYDNRFTVLECIDGDNTFFAVSNVDFDYFSYMPGFAAGNTYYGFTAFMEEERESQADPLTAQWLAQSRPLLTTSTPGYLVVNGMPTADEIQALDALHSYYATNSNALIQTYTERQALWADQIARLKSHPPTRPNTVIYYWPIKSSVYPTGGSR
jgi:hypothetical protein